MKKAATTTWAEEEFAGAKLGDVRRTRRLVEIAAGVARTPSGKVSKAFSETRAREGAYDLLENVHVRTEQVALAMYEAATARAADAGIFAYVAVDGSSLNLTDRKRTKGFGRVGTDECGARGMKVMNALCIDAKGVPIGLVDHQYWARAEPLIPGATRQEKAHHTRKRPFAEKEGIRFLEAATNATERLAKAGVRAWIVIDREGDNRGILSGLSSLSCDFTVRASWDRLIADTTQERMPIRTYIMSQPVIGTYEVEVSRTGQRAARTAEMSVRVGTVELRLRDKIKKKEERLVTQVVWVRETDASALAAGQDALDWMLYTNVSVETKEQALAVVQSYAFRWRIEGDSRHGLAAGSRARAT